MIDRNIGTGERFVRFAIALVLVGWILYSASFGILQAVALVAAFALLWNSIFARCYLWKWLGFNTCERDANGQCAQGSD
ncbi:MAG: YgaP-like transmembrane domain [Pseudomonadota bacterium]